MKKAKPQPPRRAQRNRDWLPAPANVDDLPLPTVDEMRRRIRSKPGFLASLSPETRAALAELEEPAGFGLPEPRLRRNKR